MSTETMRIRGVSQQYGARDTGRTLGVIVTEGISNEVTVDVTGTNLTDLIYPEVFIPKGAIMTAAYFETTEVFVLGGTTPTILVGTKGSEVTNGLVVTEAQAEAVGADDITATLTGTWTAATSLAAQTEVGIAFGGTTPTSTDVGKIRITIVYKKLAAS